MGECKECGGSGKYQYETKGGAEVADCEICNGTGSSPEKAEVSKCPKVATNDVDKLWQLVKIQVDDPMSKTDPYMRGMANGLICALAVFKKWEPIYIEKPKPTPPEDKLKRGI